MKVLETERLILRPYAMEDLDDLHRLLDRDLRWDEAPLTVEDRARLLADDVRAAELNPPFGRWSLVLKATGELIGLFLIRTGWMDPLIRTLFIAPAEDPAGRCNTLEVYIGYGVATGHRGQGYVSE